MRGMAGVAGLEPVTSAVTGQRSNQLSYTPRSELKKLLDIPHSVNDESNILWLVILILILFTRYKKRLGL